MNEYNEGDVMLLMKGLDKATAEIERLRAALKNISRACDDKAVNRFVIQNMVDQALNVEQAQADYAAQAAPAPTTPLAVEQIKDKRNVATETIDAVTSQRAEWKSRLMRAVLRREFDDAVLAEMLLSGLYEAHSEGLRDAAHICRETGNGRLADAIMELDKLNRRDDGQSDG